MNGGRSRGNPGVFVAGVGEAPGLPTCAPAKFLGDAVFDRSSDFSTCPCTVISVDDSWPVSQHENLLLLLPVATGPSEGEGTCAFPIRKVSTAITN